ncbi:MAG: RluA family pseudouridine synthase [Oscillospiraceae bacterium]
MRRIDFVVEPSFDGFTVERYLKEEKRLSRRLITSVKYSSGILINDKVARTVDIIRCKDVVSVIMQDEKRLEENIALNIPIIYDDDDVVIFNKPFGVPVHPSINHYNDTLGNYFSAVYKGATFRPVNRLDKDTSGLCAVAKNPFSASLLQKNTDKTYFAIVKGEIKESGRIELPIARERDTIIKRKVDESGQYAVTEYAPKMTKNGFTLLEIKLLTGRTHQIRVHFSHIGYPLVGDGLYGGDISLLSRQALHCGRLSFIHPVSNETVTVECPLPDDMAELLR